MKWRGPLFHRFLLALVDDSPGVRSLAQFLLSDTLASKARGVDMQSPPCAVDDPHAEATAHLGAMTCGATGARHMSDGGRGHERMAKHSCIRDQQAVEQNDLLR